MDVICFRVMTCSGRPGRARLERGSRRTPLARRWHPRALPDTHNRLTRVRRPSPSIPCLHEAVLFPLMRTATRFSAASAFGAVLDMVTDRFCTMALLMILSHLYKGQHLYMLFVFLAILDVVSHWCAMYRYVPHRPRPGTPRSPSRSPLNLRSPLPQLCRTLYIGAGSHKDVSGRHWLLRFYYGFPYALLVLCVTNEACLLLMYLAHHYAGPLVVLPAAVLPAFAALPAAVQTLIGFTGTGLPLVWLGVVVNFPFMALKQIISVVQLHEAMDNIADKDVADKASKKK